MSLPSWRMSRAMFGESAALRDRDSRTTAPTTRSREGRTTAIMATTSREWGKAPRWYPPCLVGASAQTLPGEQGRVGREWILEERPLLVPKQSLGTRAIGAGARSLRNRRTHPPGQRFEKSMAEFPGGGVSLPGTGARRPGGTSAQLQDSDRQVRHGHLVVVASSGRVGGDRRRAARRGCCRLLPVAAAQAGVTARAGLAALRGVRRGVRDGHGGARHRLLRPCSGA